MAYGWEGDLVRLVPLDEDKHLDNYVRWLNDPEITANILIDLPLSQIAEREIFQRLAKPDDSNIVFAIETLDGVHIGSSGIHGISYKDRNARTGSFIGEKDQWGKGYGSDAVAVRAKFCFDVLGLETIYSGYLEGNERSRKMSEKNGYTECGRFPKKFWKRGRFRDEVIMVLHREDWLKAQNAV